MNNNQSLNALTLRDDILSDDAVAIFNETIARVKPGHLIFNSLSVADDVLAVGAYRFDLSSYDNIYILGAGKASAGMAAALEDKIAAYIKAGIVIVNYGNGVYCRHVKIIEAGHPVPDENSLLAGTEIIKLAELATAKDLVIVLISGGGSALLECLPSGIDLSDLREMNNELISCGADIHEINTVRKHISLLKGGRLAGKIAPATCLSLIISDVPGDNLQSIASGPTIADDTTFSEAMAVIDKYNLAGKIRPVILDYLRQGIRGKTAEVADPAGQKVYNIIIGSNSLALQSALEIAEKKDYKVVWTQRDMQGEARDVAKDIVDSMQTFSNVSANQCLLFGGETTVTIRGNGKGGRNQELVLAALIELRNFSKPFALLSCGTDGADGPTDAAGAFINSDSWKTVTAKNISPQDYLDNNDAYTFFEQTGGLIKSGLTGTNVMDLVIVLLG